MRRWSIWLVGLVLLFVAVGTAVVIGDPDGRRGDEITQIENADGGETIIIRDGRPPFVPFGFLFFPLAIVGTVLIVKAVVGRGRGPWGPPGYGGDRQRWLEEWHRAAHAAGSVTAESPPGGSQP